MSPTAHAGHGSGPHAPVLPPSEVPPPDVVVPPPSSVPAIDADVVFAPSLEPPSASEVEVLSSIGSNPMGTHSPASSPERSWYRSPEGHPASGTAQRPVLTHTDPGRVSQSSLRWQPKAPMSTHESGITAKSTAIARWTLTIIVSAEIVPHSPRSVTRLYLPAVTPSPSDMELLYAWRNGDASAGDSLVRRHYASVLRFFEVRTRAADDLTQRTFLACVEGRERFRGDASFRTYLFAIARRLLLGHASQPQHSEALSRFDALGVPAPRTSVSMLVARRQEQQLLLASLATLAEDDQTMLILFHWEGLMAKEIGEVMGMPTSTVTTRLSRARAALKTQVERIGRRKSAGSALLQDLDGWTRSLASEDALAQLPPAVAQQVAWALTPGRGGQV